MTNFMRPEWPIEDIDYLVANWHKMSSGQLAAKLGYSRSSIMGKVHRMKLRKTATNLLTAVKVRRLQPPKVTPPQPVEPNCSTHVSDPGPTFRVTDPPRQERPEPGAFYIWELGMNDCRWSESGTKPITFCGKPGFPWCEEHKERVYVRKQADGQ